jgi:predicted metalloprotease
MRWEGGEEGGNVEDRRGMGPVGIGGGVGVIGVIVALIGYFVFGIDPRSILSAEQQVAPQAEQQGAQGAPKDAQGRFANVVFTSVNKTWAAEFQRAGRTYEPPTLVLYEQSTVTGCGIGQTAMGPFYCPRDRKVYLDLAFFRELSDRFGAPGDFARAYVIAHEVGHHVQNLLGVSDMATRSEQAAGSRSAANRVSMKVELQADCYAGVWAKRYQATGRLDPGDIDNALTAASAVGDDTLQKRTRGTVVPDSFTHGSAAQRTQWFRTGLNSGDPDACDTFGNGGSGE